MEEGKGERERRKGREGWKKGGERDRETGREMGLTWAFETSKSTPVTHLLQQGTPPNPF